MFLPQLGCFWTDTIPSPFQPDPQLVTLSCHWYLHNGREYQRLPAFNPVKTPMRQDPVISVGRISAPSVTQVWQDRWVPFCRSILRLIRLNFINLSAACWCL